jgi:peptide/nickel transport system ATP-binding protein
MSMPLLDVQDLSVHYSIKRGDVKAAEDVSFSLEKGEAMGLAGESGCGKTTVALSLLKILPINGKIVKGKILFKNTDIAKLSEGEIRNKIRWKAISLIFQGAMNAMNPMYRVEDQIIEAIRSHETRVTKKKAKERIAKLFEMVGLEPARSRNYPHEFSGGMRQRAMIAMALACNPSILIADEPGTALDVIVQAQVLKLMTELRKRLDLAMIMISHDLSIISETCDKLAIMYAGKLVELGDVITMFKKPMHPYTQGLIAAFPGIYAPKQEMKALPGSPPNLLNPPSGCRFSPRCPHAMSICKEKTPKLKEVSKGHFVSCYLVKE